MGNKKQKVLTCKDFTVSGKKFDLLLDEKLEMLITSPQPKEEELSQYYESDQYISHTDSTQSLMDKVYQWVKNYTLKQKVALINSFQSETKTILDIGCGTGDFLLACKLNKWLISGVEPNKNARNLSLTKLRKNINETNKIVIKEDLNFYLKNNIKFDVITLWHVLEHVPNLEMYISNLKKILHPNGTLVVAVPNYKSFDASYYREFWAAYDVPRHLWHFSKKSITLLFKKEKMKVIKILPMKFDSFYVSLLSEKYKSKPTNLINAFWVGLQSNYKAKRTLNYSSLIYILKNQ